MHGHALDQSFEGRAPSRMDLGQPPESESHLHCLCDYCDCTCGGPTVDDKAPHQAGAGVCIRHDELCLPHPRLLVALASAALIACITGHRHSGSKRAEKNEQHGTTAVTACACFPCQSGHELGNALSSIVVCQVAQADVGIALALQQVQIPDAHVLQRSADCAAAAFQRRRHLQHVGAAGMQGFEVRSPGTARGSSGGGRHRRRHDRLLLRGDGGGARGQADADGRSRRRCVSDTRPLPSSTMPLPNSPCSFGLAGRGLPGGRGRRADERLAPAPDQRASPPGCAVSGCSLAAAHWRRQQPTYYIIIYYYIIVITAIIIIFI